MSGHGVRGRILPETPLERREPDTTQRVTERRRWRRMRRSREGGRDIYIYIYIYKVIWKYANCTVAIKYLIPHVIEVKTI